MINMGRHPTPDIPLQSEHSLGNNVQGFGFIALTNEGKQMHFQGDQLKTNELIWLLETRQNDSTTTIC
jgi:hypothetical protein